jgi:hypothetical protein
MTPPSNAGDELIERLAAIEHERWANWQRWMMTTRCTRDDQGNLIIPAGLADRWMSLCNTPYAKLPEYSKDADRKEVNRYWPLIERYTAQQVREALEKVRAEILSLTTGGPRGVEASADIVPTNAY